MTCAYCNKCGDLLPLPYINGSRKCVHGCDDMKDAILQDIKKYVKSDEFKDSMEKQIDISLQYMENVSKALMEPIMAENPTDCSDLMRRLAAYPDWRASKKSGGYLTLDKFCKAMIDAQMQETAHNSRCIVERQILTGKKE